MAAHGDPRGGGQAQIDGRKAGRQTSPEGKPDEGDEPAVRQKRAECASSAEDRGKDQKYHENCPPNRLERSPIIRPLAAYGVPLTLHIFMPWIGSGAN